MRMFENKVVRRILGSKMDDETGEWRRLHREEYYVFIKRFDKTKNKDTGGPCGSVGDRTGAYRDLVGTPEGKRPLGRPRRRWERNFKFEFQEEVGKDMDWIDLGQVKNMWQAVMNAVMNRKFHKMRIISLTF
jgi:hypothetical protein